MSEGSQPKPTLAAVVATFSPARNLRELFTPPPENFAPLDGLRALFPFWVIATHCVFVAGIREYRAAVGEHPELRLALLSHFTLEAFFVISGFLLGNLLMRERERTGKIAVGRYFLRRAGRILPTYYLALAIYAAVGWPGRENLLYNVFYANNFLSIVQMFMPWTWSLAVEEHFYILLPFLVLAMYRTEHFRTAFWLGLFVLAVFIRLIVTDAHGLGVPATEAFGRSLEIVDRLYTKSYTRFGACALGVFVAYVYQFKRELLAKLERAPGLSWALALAALGTMVGLSTASAPIDIPYFQFGSTWPEWLLPAALALNRYLFALAFATLIILMLGRSHAGRVLGSVMSLRLFFPLAQLSYAVYLFHPLVIESFPRPQATYESLVPLFLKSCGLTYALAFVVHLAIERPFMNLRKVWRRAA